MNHDHSNGGMGSRPWRHMLLMLICCLVPIGLVIAAGTFGLSLGPLQPLVPYVAVLMCPLMMGMMMFMMMREQGGEHSHHDLDATRTKPAQRILEPGGKSTAVATQDECH